MSRLDNFIRSLASPVSKGERNVDPEATAGDARRRAEWRRRRRRYNSGGNTVEKQSVDRRAQAFAAIEQTVAERGGMRKPYDPLFLRDISANAVVQAYIDTLAQDVASASWSIRARDEDADVDDETLAKAERWLRNLHPELTFADVLEGTTRIMLELGDATWVKHYYENSNELAEIVGVDSSTMFKRVDDYGITEGYIQASRRTKDISNKFDEDEVVWFSWSGREDRHYGQGPLEKAQNEVELLEELAEKERLDLIAGSNPGVISPDYTDEFGGTVNDEDWDTFVEEMMLDEGERHRVGYSKIPVDFQPITSNYQELQVLERSKYWVTVIGSVFKVNPSYAGFDFENVNRATDETQQEAYAQRGFRVTLRQLEESINRGLIWEELSDDVRFEFEREQTASEKQTRASLVREQAEAGKEMAEALEGSDAGVSIRDGKLIVEDGELSAPDDGGGGGGFFASVDDPVEADGVIRTKSYAKEIPDAVLDEISTDRFVPPESVADECRRALELIDEHGRDTASGGTSEALARARQIVDHYESGDPLIGTNDDGVPYVVEIANFFARHRAQGNHEFDDDEHENRYEDPGWLADKLWGGDPGFDWATALAERIDEVESELIESAGGSGKANSDDVADTVVARLSDDEWASYDRALLEAHATQIQPDSVDDIEKRAWNRDDEVPEYVREGVLNAIDRGAIFEQIESVPGTLRETLEDILRDSLTQSQGWSLDSIVDRLSDAFPGVGTDDLETVARTETTSVLNEAREAGYESREDADRFRYYWQGSEDSRTTQACTDIMIATGTASGTPETDFSEVPGEAVDMTTLKRLEREASDYHFPDLQFREHVPHINCRKTFVRDASADIDIDVDVPGHEEFNEEFSKAACTCDHDDPVVYDDVVGRIRKYVDSRSSRERQIEQALGESIVQVLRRAFDESGGTVEGAKRAINRRLEASPSYDHDADGLLSKPTLYNYRDKYESRIDDVAG